MKALHRDYVPVTGIIKRKRAYVRMLKGLTIAGLEGKDCRLVTLTTPAGYPAGEVHHAWRKFRLAAKRRGIDFEYIAVREWNAAKTCVHLHVIFKCSSRIDYTGLREAWQNALGADFAWVHIDYVDREDGRGLANYLCKYLVKSLEGLEVSKRGRAQGRKPQARTFSRLYWYSRGWLFNGWSTFSKRMYQCKRTLTMAELVHIAGAGKSERAVIELNMIYRAMREVQGVIPQPVDDRRLGNWLGEYLERAVRYGK